MQLANGDLFSAIEMNPELTSSGLTVQVFTDDGSSYQFVSGSGQNRFYALADAGSAIRYIDLIAPANTLASVRQIRIGAITPAEVPEPSTWVMLTMGLAIVFGISRRKRASQQLAADGLA